MSTIVRTQSGCELLLRCNGTAGRSSVVYSHSNPLILVDGRDLCSRNEDVLSVRSLKIPGRSSPSIAQMECANGVICCEKVHPVHEIIVGDSKISTKRKGLKVCSDSLCFSVPDVLHRCDVCELDRVVDRALVYGNLIDNNEKKQDLQLQGQQPEVEADSQNLQALEPKDEVKVTHVRCSNMQCTEISDTLILCKGCEREYYCGARCAALDRDRHAPLCGFKVAYESSMGRVLIALRDFKMGDVVLREPLLMWESHKEDEAPMNFLKAYLSADRETRRKIDDLYTPNSDTDNVNVLYAKNTAASLAKLQAQMIVPDHKSVCTCDCSKQGSKKSNSDMRYVEDCTGEGECVCECKCTPKDRIDREFKHISQNSLVRLMLKRNFNAWSMDPSGTKEGLGYYASMLNHSCDPNVKGGPVSGTLEYTATRAIRKGEELTVSYFDNSLIFQSLQERREALLASHAFQCCCNRCIGPDLVRPLHCPVNGCDSVCLRTSSIQYVDDDSSGGPDPGVWICQDPGCSFKGSDNEGDMPVQISAEKRLLRLANVTESREDFLYKLRKMEAVLPPAHHAYLKLFHCYGLALEDIRAPLADKQTTTFALLELILWRERFMAIHTAARCSQEHGMKWSIDSWCKNKWRLVKWSGREHASESTHDYLVDIWRTGQGRANETAIVTLQPNLLTKDPVIMSVNRLLLLNMTKLAIILLLRYSAVASAEEFTEGVVPDGDF
ncbi:hypothetical protein SARC_10794 [Sphaeroforma arctica JP610]|uniref:SET domain-containing protein n=1 Tax=Sphaeroforma arctica JP610 TaxID=667725 RepID=A0A0L0FIY9_9EUKA|nr:hypothetical protein SARC_10794 [Sphaeroforma arctica JP610]KNC76720.1 hypothetical protein SARC_10794 [Sphaeroforma arctica JP610]|eukprot:XP_014150622.1 hypothetical protein SARC_10794 [Sphaeroforma arctica JP610]